MKGGSRLDLFRGIELYERRLGVDYGMPAHQSRTPASGAAPSFMLQIEGRKPPQQSIDCLYEENRISLFRRSADEAIGPLGLKRSLI
jgi:hypothetical protein